MPKLTTTTTKPQMMTIPAAIRNQSSTSQLVPQLTKSLKKIISSAAINAVKTDTYVPLSLSKGLVSVF